MAKKTLGYVELEWKCPVCGTRNPGTGRVCQSCGAPQPENVAFESPGQTELRKDAATVAQAQAGPDIHCPYCDARNPAGAKVCKQCGGDLTTAKARSVGQVVGAYGASRPDVKCPACGTLNPAGARVCKSCGAPLPVAAAAPAIQPAAPASGGRGCLWVGLGVLALLLIAAAFLFIRGGETLATQAEVVDARWVRTIDVQGLVPVRRVAWRDEVPGDASLGACRDEVRDIVDSPVPGAREVCGTPYTVDTGTGLGEVMQDCVYEVLEQRCEYTVNEWRTVDQIVAEGSGFSPEWPALTVDRSQRAGDRGERFQCIFSVDGRTYTLDMPTYADYQLCTVGSVWSLEVNGGGRVLNAAPLQ